MEGYHSETIDREDLLVPFLCADRAQNVSHLSSTTRASRFNVDRDTLYPVRVDS